MKFLLVKERIQKAGRNFRRLMKDSSAVAMVEFAMILPMLTVLTLGSFEVARYALLTQKLDRVSATMADLTARAEALTASEVDNLFDSTDHLAQPFDFNTDGMVVISSIVGRLNQPPLIIGQRSQGNISGVNSVIGSNGGDATLPEAFKNQETGQVLEDGDGLIVAEVFYDYAPYLSLGGNLLDDILGEMIIYRRAFFRPRLSEQTTFN
ncbi:MAG: pilus assembly protein [Sneathiella sp.]|nr:pilus assembly protein [Sneathiella sp.]